MREKFCRELIPATLRARILMPSPACDGTSVPTPNVAGDRRLEGWSRCLAGPSPGGPVRSLRRCEKCQAAGCCDELLCGRCAPRATGTWAGSQSPDRDTNRRTRVPEGNPRDREVPWRARPGSRGGLTTSWGGSNRPAVVEYGTRVPSLYLLTLAACERQEETARGRADGRPELRPGAPCAPSPSCWKRASGIALAEGETAWPDF